MTVVRLEALAANLGDLWSVPHLTDGLRIEFSARMTNGLGRCFPERRTVRLNADLASDSGHKLREVFCHELAHLAVYLLHGSSAKPHGLEWRELVQQAGYTPHRRLARKGLRHRRSGSVGCRVLYEHRCPICQNVRYSPVASARWRCGECAADGIESVMSVRNALTPTRSC